jgi:hypothetical protein
MGHGSFVTRKLSSSNRSQERYQPEWIRIRDCPFSKAHVYRLIKAGLLKSALFDALGLGRGVRLINRRSLEELIGREAAAK